MLFGVVGVFNNRSDWNDAAQAYKHRHCIPVIIWIPKKVVGEDTIDGGE